MKPKDRLRAAQEEWRRTDLARAAQKSAMRQAGFQTDSGIPIPDLLTPADTGDPSDADVEKYQRDLGFPGQFPYTRGPQPSMYRGRLWTMRQFAGFGTPEDTNKRFKYLLAHGQTGLSTAFDLPTLMGRDADDPWSEGEVGICGVAIRRTVCPKSAGLALFPYRIDSRSFRSDWEFADCGTARRRFAPCRRGGP